MQTVAGIKLPKCRRGMLSDELSIDKHKRNSNNKEFPGGAARKSEAVNNVIDREAHA